jgi:rhodanese-related sulfurtransferase
MKFKIVLLIVLAVAISTTAVFAAEIPTNPKEQTSWGLYVDSREAYDMKQKLGDKMLLIDVRDPIEIMFTGFTDTVDINIPFKLANPNVWNNDKSVFQVEVNPNFEQEIAAALEAHGLTKEVPIVLMCRSGGTRGAPATKLLENKGYKQIYVVTDGFEGDKITDGERKNWRLKNGWKNSGLPWSYKLNKEKMYFHPAK